MTTIAQNKELLKHLFELLQAHRSIFKQERSYQRVVALVLAELFVFARHTITQLLMSLGQTDQDWSAWYRVLSQGRFGYDRAREVLFKETLRHVGEEGLYVVAGDATQTPRSSRRLEGSGWLGNLRTPRFMVGIHAAQRWFNGCWLVPPEAGYSRAVPIYWQPAFTEKSQPKDHPPMSERSAALRFIQWLCQQFADCGRASQPILFVGDGAYDSLTLWQALPLGVTLLARSAKNRVLYHLPTPPSAHQRGRTRLYGERAATPQAVWQARGGWQAVTLEVRGRTRHLQVKVRGVFIRKGAAHCPLFLIVVRGKDNTRTRRDPLPFLVNAQPTDSGSWQLPLPLETLLFWAWQRWELEVCHRELKSNFGLGNKQCFNPQAAVASVQWSAWVYALLLLAGYRTFGLTRGPTVPTRWWRGAPRWSLNTLWRAYRAALWQQHTFHPLCSPTPSDWGEKELLLLALRNAVLAAARS
jgi:DDE superfamily endonuclease